MFTSRRIKNQNQNQTLELSIVLSIGHKYVFHIHKVNMAIEMNLLFNYKVNLLEQLGVCPKFHVWLAWQNVVITSEQFSQNS